MPVPSLAAATPSANLSIHTETAVGCVAGPDNRGTMSLLLSCLTTIFLCTWTVLHLDVPRTEEKRTVLATFKRKAIWMAFVAIAPEFVASRAVGEYFEARQTRKVLSSKVEGSEWSLTQAFFLHMGGLAYRSPDEDGVFTTTILTKDAVEKLLESNTRNPSEVPLKFEDIPKDTTIQDKSKSDGLAKSLALLQCVWFISQVLARAIDYLPITTLELGTTAFIGCASVAYGFWFFKPQDVRTPIEIQSNQGLGSTLDLPVDRVTPDDFLDSVRKPSAFLAFVFSAFFVGGIHCAAWNFLFPTPIEHLLWRIASVLVFVLPFLEILAVTVVGHFKSSDIPVWTALWIFPSLYVILRLFLIIEMFMSLRKVSPAVYHQLPWSDFIPVDVGYAGLNHACG